MKNEGGFTLIELTLVITIIGILAAIAIPAFLGQREKAKTLEGRILAGDLRKDVMEFYWHTGRFPKDNAEAGIAEPEHIKGQFVNSITIRDGVISWKKGTSGGHDGELTPSIFVEDPTSTVLWVNERRLPEGYQMVSKGASDAERR